MSNTGDEFTLEEWEQWMKDWLLDPYTTKLDETQFRVDLFDTTDAYIVEATPSDFTMQEVKLEKQEQTLSIEILPADDITIRKRSLEFPFSLKYNPIRLYLRKGFIEIHILKALDKKPGPSVIRCQGQI
ncbi:hypothetical protein FZC84_07735 [Rossellomorea vietnamensis]|uniref:Hsp20/alpha crystallin family protein n=1 Tax=Rossellomorea vietnamensis TaxID=218284 RepID=A0A5D4MEU6_9BACI|nr:MULTISPECIES: hypothetical protein [Bacillaceae]TYS00420.1 hypothetical protein FZC84_07735 [Rossellomorea vietnamensis]